jgi:hypothetical protein
MTMTKFTSKKREFTHVKSGWCVREIVADIPNLGVEPTFRIFYGPLQPGAAHPTVVHAYSPPDADGGFVDLPDLESAVDWINRRGPRPAVRGVR